MPAIIAFVFGLLFFLMSAAALVLEGEAGAYMLWRLPLLTLAGLHAVAGFLAIGGHSLYLGRRWSAAAGPAVVSAIASAAVALVAFHLAARYRIALPRDTALFVVIATLLIGSANVALVALRARRQSGRAPT